MKKLWIPLVVMISAAPALSASQNPFDIHQNMQQIDHEQQRLLDELRVLAHEYKDTTEKQSIKSTTLQKTAPQSRPGASSPHKALPVKHAPATTVSKKAVVRGPDRVDEVRKKMMALEAAKAAASAKAAQASKTAKEKMKQAQLAREKALKEKATGTAAGEKRSGLEEDAKKAAEEALRKAIMEVEAAGH